MVGVVSMLQFVISYCLFLIIMIDRINICNIELPFLYVQNQFVPLYQDLSLRFICYVI